MRDALREKQVLELATTGLTVIQIATTLHITHSTAKTHLLRVYETLEARNRSAAVAIALARGILRVRPTAADACGWAMSAGLSGDLRAFRETGQTSYCGNCDTR